MIYVENGQQFQCTIGSNGWFSSKLNFKISEMMKIYVGNQVKPAVEIVLYLNLSLNSTVIGGKVCDA